MRKRTKAKGNHVVSAPASGVLLRRLRKYWKPQQVERRGGLVIRRYKSLPAVEAMRRDASQHETVNS